MLPQLSNFLSENWDTLFSKDTKKPKKISFLGIWGSLEGGKVSFLAFADKDKKPSFIVKILRNHNKLNQILNERDILLYLNSLNHSISDSIPRVIGCEKIAGSWLLIESLLEGKPMMVVMGSNGLPEQKNTEANFSLVKEWLTKFNNATKDPKVLTDDLLRGYIINPVEEFQAIFPLSKEEKDYLKKIVLIIQEFKDSNIDLFLKHGDLCRQNILVFQDKIGLIDWEFSQKSALPLYDFFFFFTTYYFQAMKDSRVESHLDCFKHTFFDKNDYSNLIKYYLIKYCQELDIDFGLIQVFFTLFLLEKAIFEYHNLLGLSERGFLPLLEESSGKSKNSYLYALKDQLWISLFRFFVKEQKQFIFEHE